MISADYSNIVGSLKLGAVTRVSFGNNPIIDQFPEFARHLHAAGGPDALSLFALPDVGFSRLHDTPVVTWYSDRKGAPQRLEELSPEQRGDVERIAREQLSALQESDDPQLLDMLRLALNVAAPGSLIAIGSQPVLINWGLLPSDLDDTAPAYGAHIAKTIGPVLPVGLLPERTPTGVGMAAPASPDDVSGGKDVPDTEAASVSGAAGDAASVAATAAVVSAGDVGGGGSGNTGAGDGQGNPRQPVAAVVYEREPDHRWGLWSSIVLGLLTLFLATFLVYILWPGNLIYPPRGSVRLADAEQISLNNNSIVAIRDQIGRLQTSLYGDICVADDRVILDGLAGLSFLPGIDGNARTLRPEGTSFPQPQPQTDGPAPGSGAGGSAARSEPLEGSRLLGKLDKSTVFVVSSAEGGISTGSGVIVAPDHVLTNYHVVENFDGRRLIVTNQEIGIVDAEVVARTDGSDIGGSDFALLKLKRPVDIEAVTLARDVERLDPVVAAGFPAFVIQTDPGFVAAFQGGDESQLERVQMAVTQGVVMAEQAANGVTVIAHSATISSGNSGGPLVDRCGRVVGINTFARTDAENALRNNYALSAVDAARFLDSSGVTSPLDVRRCMADSVPPTAQVTSPADAPLDMQPAAPAKVETAPRMEGHLPSPDEVLGSSDPGPRDTEADSLNIPLD